MSKIKILFIHSKLVCGGAEQALFDLISLMDKEKFDITVLVQYDGGIWEQKFRDAGIRVVSIWDCQKKSAIPLWKLYNWFKRRQIAQALARDGEGLLKVCLRERFDIIVSYSGSTLQKMCFSGHAKTVKYIHCDIAGSQLFSENTLAQLSTLKQFNRIICVSEIAKLSFVEITGISENVMAFHNPLNSEKVIRLSQAEIALPHDLPLICAVGRLAEEKGFDRLLRIHKNLLEEGILHRLVLVGDGPEKENLERLIHALCVQDSVIMAGYQANPYPYMRQSDFLICSSFTEGLGLVAMEAICLGVPVVSSAPSVRELFDNENCGLVTNSDDISLEIGIRRMLTDRKFYEQAKAGAEKRSEFFNGKRMVREIEDELIALVHS